MPATPSRRVGLLAGVAYDWFASPAILDETQEVRARPRFRATSGQVRLWRDAFARASRQVFPDLIPGEGARAVRGDVEGLPILKTAYAVAAVGEDFGAILAAARSDGGWLIVSEDIRHFTPGWSVHGGQFSTAQAFWRLLKGRGAGGVVSARWNSYLDSYAHEQGQTATTHARVSRTAFSLKEAKHRTCANSGGRP